jgi:hypothetical protein
VEHGQDCLAAALDGQAGHLHLARGFLSGVHHEEHEGHEAGKQGLGTKNFVVFVSFVVKI